MSPKNNSKNKKKEKTKSAKPTSPAAAKKRFGNAVANGIVSKKELYGVKDVFGNSVRVTRRENGKLNYQFDPSYDEQKLTEATDHFMKNTAPYLEAKAASDDGWEELLESYG